MPGTLGERLALVLIAGAALAAPALVLEVRSADRVMLLPMRDTALVSAYRQSIYDVSVRELLEVEAGGFRIDRAMSEDLRALEYFRWPGEPRRTGSAYVWDAPPNAVSRLEIAVVPSGAQTLETSGRDIRLIEAFGESSVTVTASWRPLAAWLWWALWP